MKASRLLANWQRRIGDTYTDAKGQTGVLRDVYFRPRRGAGADWGVYLTLENEHGQWTARPAFVTCVAREEGRAL